ncbi:hypothetical protein B0T19DRAFT_405095 [Cercophora scortea]|uniref:Uncharacterized protein n=1 Tax=Cercophora scortea TaxID=314031 RepID=A0AAE0I2T4_9PEZI|nr:hypothetical protein B0T19DRAFT_405095 [Cercophora scortea]
MAVGLAICAFSRAADADLRLMWKSPRGDKPDLSQTFVDGVDIPLSWKTVNGSGLYDLWLTRWELDAHPLVVYLARAIDLGHAGNFTLTITSLPPRKMTTTTSTSTTTKYTLCFKPHARQDSPSQGPGPSYSSPSFFIADASEPSDLRRHVLPSSPMTTPSSPPQSANPILSDTTSPASEPDPSYPTVSPGAAAGLAIGLILAVALLAAIEIAYLMWWRRRRQPGDRPQSQPQLPAAEVAGEGERRRGIKVRWKPWGVFGRLRWVDREDDVPPVTPVPLLEVESGFAFPQVPVYELQGRGMEGGMKSKTGTRKSRRKSRYTVKVNSVPVELEGG